MKPKIVSSLIILTIILSMYSCTKDFVDQNITHQTIQLMAPGNGIQTQIQSQTFWWNELDGADQYELEIVKGTFVSAIQLEIDTIVTTTKFKYTLYPGMYQWRVRGMNGGGNTQFSTYSLTIDTASTLSGQNVILVSPLSNAYSNSLSNTFTWDSIFGATNYHVQIINQATSSIVVDTTFKGISFTRSLGEGIFTWQVSAENATTSSAFSSRTFTIDTTHPGTPTLIVPINDSSLVKETVTLKWANGTSGPSPVYDSLYIYSSSSMTTVVKSASLTSTIFSDSLVPGSYYWRVRTISATGNKSAYSTLWNFVTQ